MPMIPEPEREKIREIFDRDLVNDVSLELYTQKPSPLFVPGQSQCQSCPETQQLVEEVADLSDKLHLAVHDVKAEPEIATEAGIEHIPALLLKGTNAGRMRFLGPPAGYEFSTLITDLVDVSSGRIELSEEAQQSLAAIAEPVHIQVFVTPT